MAPKALITHQQCGVDCYSSNNWWFISGQVLFSLVIPLMKIHCGELELEFECSITYLEIYRPENCECHTIKLSQIQLLIEI